MKKHLLSLLFLLCLCGISSAQDAPMKWGKVDKEDLLMKVYPHDSSAAAVVLADYGVAYFTFNSDKGFELNMDRHTRIKILNTNGLEYANQQIALYHRGLNKEEVNSLKGITYNLEGNKVQKYKMSKKEAFTEAYDEQIDFVKFTLPNVKEGSVIEFKYTLKSDFIYNLFTWKFQSDIPVRWSEFRAKIPEYFYYKSFMGGFMPLTLAESKSYKDSFRYNITSVDPGIGRSGSVRSSGTLSPDGTAFRWVLENVPAIKEEAYITTIQDYLSRIEFELSYTKYPGKGINNYSSSWEKLAEEFLKDPRFGGQLKRERYLREAIAGLEKEASGIELINQVVLYVKKNLHYNGKARVYTENSLKKVFDSKEGNAAEINLLLTLMLREAGFTANPVILSTRDHGKINPVIPLEKDFNFVVAAVKLEEGYVLLDGTDPSLPVGMLPFQCMNQQGRLIAESYSAWVPLRNNEIIKEASQAELVLTAAGNLSGTLTRRHEGYAAVYSRNQFHEQGEEKYIREEYGETGWNISDFGIENAEMLSDQLTESFTLDAQEAITVAGDRMYFQPLLIDKETENPFKLEARNFPVDFGCPRERLSVVKIKLPEGYEVEEIPEQMVVTLPDKSGTFRFMVSEINGQLTVMSSLKFEKAMYLPEEYAALKRFNEMVVAKHAEQVVLKKIN